MDYENRFIVRVGWDQFEFVNSLILLPDIIDFFHSSWYILIAVLIVQI
jgi:hypothetical protein